MFVFFITIYIIIAITLLSKIKGYFKTYIIVHDNSKSYIDSIMNYMNHYFTHIWRKKLAYERHFGDLGYIKEQLMNYQYKNLPLVYDKFKYLDSISANSSTIANRKLFKNLLQQLEKELPMTLDEGRHNFIKHTLKSVLIFNLTTIPVIFLMYYFEILQGTYFYITGFSFVIFTLMQIISIIKYFFLYKKVAVNNEYFHKFSYQYLYEIIYYKSFKLLSRDSDKDKQIIEVLELIKECEFQEDLSSYDEEQFMDMYENINKVIDTIVHTNSSKAEFFKAINVFIDYIDKNSLGLMKKQPVINNKEYLHSIIEDMKSSYV